MQVLIKAGEGELTVVPSVLKALDLQGKVVTGDALFAQRNLSIEIVQAKGDYVWKVKGNQATLEADIASVFEPDPTRQARLQPAQERLSHCHADLGWTRLDRDPHFDHRAGLTQGLQRLAVS